MKITWKNPPSPGDPVVVGLKGKVDEHVGASFATFIEDLPKGPIDIDMDAVTYINSIGCSHWVSLLRTLKKTRQVELINCREPVIDYANLLPQFLDGARVKSLYFPLVCSKCGRAQSALLTAAELTADAAGAIAKVTCEACKGPMEAALEPGDFLEFLFERP